MSTDTTCRRHFGEPFWPLGTCRFCNTCRNNLQTAAASFAYAKCMARVWAQSKQSWNLTLSQIEQLRSQLSFSNHHLLHWRSYKTKLSIKKSCVCNMIFAKPILFHAIHIAIQCHTYVTHFCCCMPEMINIYALLGIGLHLNAPRDLTDITSLATAASHPT